MATPKALKRASNLSKAAMAIRAAKVMVLTVFIFERVIVGEVLVEVVKNACYFLPEV